MKHRLLLCIPFMIFVGAVNSVAQPVPQVIVARAESQEWFNSIEALGTLKANETVVLTASVTDTITSIHFKDGQRVEKGFVLAEMTDSEESALVKEMNAKAAEASRQYKRLKDLPNKGAVSESLFDQRQREYRAARAQLEAMKSRLQDRLIIAPFSGVLGLRNISVGALVAPGDEIVTLTDDSSMKLDFAVPAVYLSSLEPGLPIIATTDAYPDINFKGSVASVDSRVDPVTRSITVRAIIDNPERLLRPGLLMSVELRYQFREGITIREEALLPVGEENDVMIVDQESNQVERSRVKVGRRVFGKVEVLNGVNAGQMVVTHGNQKVRPGQKVSILAVQEDGQDLKEILSRQSEGEMSKAS